METSALSSSQLFWFIITGTMCITVGYVVIFAILQRREGHLEAFLADGNAVKLLTVVIVVFATTVLTVMGVFNEAVSAIFAGIVGYVLGSMRRTKTGDR